MDYLKLFENHSQYETFINGGGVAKPNVSHCIQENKVHYNPIPHDYSKDYLTFMALEDGQFGFITSTNNVISYSIDEGRTWTELERNSPTSTVTAGNKIMWKGELEEIGEHNGIGSFASSGSFDVQGNVMSLLYGDNFGGQTNTSRLCNLFCRVEEQQQIEGPSIYEYYPCSVVNAKNLVLPATTLTEGCYHEMFRDCTSLTSAPELPATTLASQCYRDMFRGCTSLANVPPIGTTATTMAVNACTFMFRGCTSLTTAPELPATTLALCCYQNMFENCASLTTAPELPATTLAEACYNVMFAGCTSLTTAPELPATTLADSCYMSMFQDCTSLTTAPELPATTLTDYCYAHMFYGCTSLNYIKAMFTTTPSGSSPNYYTLNWVSGVASTGRFVKACDATWNVSGVNGIPEGWTVGYQQANGEPCEEIK